MNFFNQLQYRACGDCLTDVAHCFRPQCIAADGVAATLISVNKQMPGPMIEVIFNKTIVFSSSVFIFI